MAQVQSKTRYNNGDQPLVMAWIGNDDPHRGDSKGSIGLAKLCAEMVNGRYVYVDQAMLDANFPKAKDYQDQVTMALWKFGQPDILIGSTGSDPFCAAEKRPLITLAHINERYMNKYCVEDKLVPHHLTNKLLGSEGKEFKNRYSEIKGPLVAVMIGDDHDDVCDTARKLNDIGRQYDEITFFICPSRRAYNAPSIISNHLGNKLASAFNSKSFTEYFQGLFDKPINVISYDYEAEIDNYNPYLGLLSCADHIVVSGHSFSLVSEALFTGKNIYIDEIDDVYKSLTNKGYITQLGSLQSQQFPTVKKEPLDITREIAVTIAENFKNNKRMTL